MSRKTNIDIQISFYLLNKYDYDALKSNFLLLCTESESEDHNIFSLFSIFSIAILFPIDWKLPMNFDSNFFELNYSLLAYFG